MEPDTVVQLITDPRPRCWKCDKLQADYLTRPWRRKCDRCNSVNGARAPKPGEITGPEQDFNEDATTDES